jgi:1,4-dihydroxy-2-naphthoyl-CoA hydrolase
VTDNAGSADTADADSAGADVPADPALTAFFTSTMPLMATLGAEALAAAPDGVRTRLRWRPALCTAGGLLHGGTLMALADATGAWCAYLHLPPDCSTTTVQSSTSFLRGVRSGAVTAHATPVHVGRSLVVVDTELRDADARLIARTTQTQAVLPPG